MDAGSDPTRAIRSARRRSNAMSSRGLFPRGGAGKHDTVLGPETDTDLVAFAEPRAAAIRFDDHQGPCRAIDAVMELSPHIDHVDDLALQLIGARSRFLLSVLGQD